MRNKITPWAWVPTLYFAEGIPYFIVNTISVVMYKNLGMPNGRLAALTSLLYLPWVIKPFWSPFVDIIGTKRRWIIWMQLAMTAAFVALALSVHPTFFTFSLIFFWITAFASATHDIAADGFYMLALDHKRQAVFVGIRSLFYRVSMIFGQGVLVFIAGYLERRLGSVPTAWRITLLITALIFAVLSVWHIFLLPRPAEDAVREDAGTAKEIFRGFGRTFATFFTKPGIWLAMCFLLLFRLPEALSIKMLTPFLLDTAAAGGLALSTEQVGLAYGTIGVAGLVAGGILGGIAAAKWGLRKSLVPMVCCVAIPCLVYVYLAMARPENLWIVSGCILLDQFGYGFGFTAYMLYMIHVSEGEFKTSHYSLCTAFMALSMMIPGLFAGYLQEALGYTGFFILVMACSLLSIPITALAARKVPKNE